MNTSTYNNIRISENDNVYIKIKSGWFQKPISEEFKTEKYYIILNYFLLEAAPEGLSYKYKELKEKGWPNDVFRSSILFNHMFSNFLYKKSIFIVEKRDDFKQSLNKINFDKSFHNIREEGIAVQKKSNMNRINSVLYHIRNSFAHGRFQIYNFNNEVFYCLESGIIKKKANVFCLKSRMIIKEKTFLSWIELFNNPIKDDDEKVKKRKHKKK